ncbi:hypothetical protein [Methanocaldococcus vulcanius]|nr:hypothetical protein [Methanocaldococcus vulcanius]
MPTIEQNPEDFVAQSKALKTITLRVPSNIPKKKIEEFIKKLELEEKFKKTEEFKLFVKDEDWKMKIYKIAEFVENYLKKKYPNEKFEIVLDYDGIDDKVVIRVVFKKKLDKRKLKDIKFVEKLVDKINKIIDDVGLECHDKFHELMCCVLVTSELEVL